MALMTEGVSHLLPSPIPLSLLMQRFLLSWLFLEQHMVNPLCWRQEHSFPELFLSPCSWTF